MFTQGAAQCQCTSFEPLCESCDCGCLVIARSDDSAPDPKICFRQVKFIVWIFVGHVVMSASKHFLFFFGVVNKDVED